MVKKMEKCWHLKILSLHLHSRNGKPDSLAQLVEHDTLNVGVQGSIPWRVTRKAASLLAAFLVTWRQSRHCMTPSFISPQGR